MDHYLVNYSLPAPSLTVKTMLALHKYNGENQL